MAHVDLIGGRYRVVGRLGVGGVAEVYDAVDVGIQRPVAIKALRPEHRALEDVRLRLVREAYLGARLVHPHVCGVSDIGTLADGSPFVVMDRLYGRTVAERIATSGPLAPAAALTFAEQILSALGAAHELGIVHRDVKPANVFMNEVRGLPPLAKLLDFGAALCPSSLLRMPDVAPIDSQLTAAGSVVGTPHYLAPEQATGMRDLDARTDVYQVGVFLYEALSGKKPYQGGSYGELVTKIADGQMTPLESVAPQLPAPIASVVARALATQRERRYQRADEMLEAVRAARSGAVTSQKAWEQATDASITAPMLPRDRIR